MQQVHKETLDRIENAIEGREDPTVEIFGMTGIPEPVEKAHRERIQREFFADQANHRTNSGNVPGAQPSKKIKIETPEEIKKRLAEHRARKAAGELNVGSGPNTPQVSFFSLPISSEILC